VPLWPQGKATASDLCAATESPAREGGPVPRTTTSEVHRYKANATDKRTLTRLTPEGQ